MAFFRRLNPIIPTTTIATYQDTELLLSTADFATQLSTPKFIIQLDQTIPSGVIYPAVMTLTGLSDSYVNLYDRLGYYVRADRLIRAMQMRSCNTWTSNCNCARYNEFQCVIRFDPLRVYVLDNLPCSTYIPTTTDTTTGTSTTGTTTTDNTTPTTSTDATIRTASIVPSLK